MLALSRRLAVFAVAALMLTACNKGPTKADASDMSLGKPDAKVQVVEYASLSCPHCARFNNDVFPAFKAKYIDTGLVHYTFREFLTEPVALASGGALMARCLAKTGGPDKYFAVVDAVFHGQDEIVRTGDMRGVLLRIGQASGMTEAQFDSCVGDEDAMKAMNKRIEGYVKNDKIEATPTFIINGKKLEGEQTMATLDAAIQPLLK
jgi:protein-disulfide isomerase